MTSKVKKHSLFPIAYDEVSLVDEGAAGSAYVLITKRDTADQKPRSKKDKKGRSLQNPCSDETNSTGAKDGKSKRSKNFKETKHPRDEKGRMKETSAKSKAENGKGGTTKAKLDAACRGKGKKKTGTTKLPPKTVTKSSLLSWDKNTQVLNIMERKAAR